MTMSEHLRDRLHEEMSGHQPPPADDLVARAVAGAVRTRRTRRTASGFGTAAVVGVTLLGVTYGSRLRPGSSSSSVQAGSPAGAAAGTVTAGSGVKAETATP